MLKTGGVAVEPKKTYSLPMSQYKVVEIYFKEESRDIQKAIDNEVELGWVFLTISTYSKQVDNTNKAHAVLVFSKD